MFTIVLDEKRLGEIVQSAVLKAMETKSEEEKAIGRGMDSDKRYLYSLKELADFIHCSLPTAQRMKNEGRIPYRQTGRKVIYDTYEILKSLEHLENKKFKRRK